MNSHKLCRPYFRYIGQRKYWLFHTHMNNTFDFELGDGKTTENYSDNFDVHGHAVKYRDTNLPVFDYDFSIKIFSYNKDVGRVELAHVGINYKDVFEPFVYNPKYLKKHQVTYLSYVCFTLFIGIFNFVFSAYKKRIANNYDIAVPIYETLRQLNKIFTSFKSSGVDVFEYTDMIRTGYLLGMNPVNRVGYDKYYYIPCTDLQFKKFLKSGGYNNLNP